MKEIIIGSLSVGAEEVIVSKGLVYTDRYQQINEASNSAWVDLADAILAAIKKNPKAIFRLTKVEGDRYIVNNSDAIIPGDYFFYNEDPDEWYPLIYSQDIVESWGSQLTIRDLPKYADFVRTAQLATTAMRSNKPFYFNFVDGNIVTDNPASSPSRAVSKEAFELLTNFVKRARATGGRVTLVGEKDEVHAYSYNGDERVEIELGVKSILI